MSGDILTFYNNQDANFPGAVSLGSNISSVLPGAIRYNANTDRFEGYLNTIQPYNNSKWAPMSFTVASSSNLGGIKVGNNLSITADGQLNATAEGVSRKFQKTLIVSQAPNSGDYTSIGECITEFFGYDPATSTYPSGELAGLDRTYYPFPGPDSRYIILVSPGVYNESIYGTINMPPYVSLVGDGENAVFINIDSTLAIRCREGNIIDKLTIDLSAVNQSSSIVPGPVVGIQLHSSSGTYNSANNVILSNLTFTLTALRVTTSIVSASNVQSIDIYNLATNITDLPVPVSYTNQEVNIIKSITSSINFKDSTIYLEGLRASKYIINASSLSIININNCQFTVTEQNTSQLASHHNSCLNLTDTELTCNYSQIQCLGYDETLNSDTQRCYGIELDSTQSIYNTPIPSMSGVIFEHYPDGSQPDEVVVQQSIRDFTTNYTNGDYIKITGSSIAQNNCITRVINVFNELRDYGSGSLLYSIIQIEHSTEFVDDITNSAVTLAILYNVSLFASQVTSTNETLIFPRTSPGNLANYRAQISNTELNGANPSLGQNALIFAFPYEIYVGKEASDYTSIRSALASITDATATRPYIVHVRPGLYTETGTLAVPSYVSLIGESSKAVIIKFDVNSAGYGSQNIALSLASYTTISGLTLNITNGLDSGITSRLAGVGSSNLDQPEISASSLVDITMVDLNILLDTFSITQSRVAINMFKSSYTARNISVTLTPASISPAVIELIGLKQTLGSSNITNLLINTATGSSINNASIYGLYSDRGTIQLANPVISLANTGATNSSNYGIFVTNTADTSSVGSTIASENTIITGGIIRCSAGTTNRVLHAGYHSTLIVNNALTQGDYFNYQGIVHSFLKTVNCYFITMTGSSITNISPVDILGRPMIANDSLFVGDPVGASVITGTKNVLMGVRTGTKIGSGSRNTFIGVETGQGSISGVDNVYIGQGTANSAVGSYQVIIGSEAGRQLVSGGENVLIGSLAGSNMSSGSNITVLGSRTLENASNNQDIIAIGKSSARQLTGSSHNIILGNNTAGVLTSGSRAILIGDDTASNMSTPSDNIIIGHTAGRNLVSGTRNTMLGNNAGQNLVSGDDNTLLGYQAGQGIGTPAFSKNTIIGAKTGQGLTTGSANTLFGANVAPNLTTGARNIITGSQHPVYPASSPGASLTTGSDNIITGVNSASNLTVGVKNIVLGNQSGASLNGTSDTIIIGHESGSNISGSAVDDGENIVIGNYAGQQITSGRAIIIGHEAGQSASGTDICIIGNQAGKTVAGPRNTIIGNYAAGLSSNPNSYPMLGADNVLIGTYSGFQLETGNFNIVIGSGDGSNGATGYNLTSGDANMLLGYRAGRSLTSGDRNVIMGSNAGSAMSESSLNLVIGNEAGVNLGANDTSNPKSDNNLIMGNYAGYNYEQATQLLLIGQNAGFEGITGDNNTYIGNDAGHENQTGSDNTMIGNRAGYNITSSQNTMIGADAGRYCTDASENTFIGYETGRGLNELTPNTGDKNTALGYQAGQLLQDGSQNILLGYKAGQSNPNGVNNIMMGPQAGQNSTASQSIFIGSALTDAPGVGIGAQTTGNYDIFIGADAGLNNTSGTKNIAVGFMANKYNTTGSEGISIGSSAGLNNTSGDENITIGKNTGLQNTTGDRNIIIGSHAGELTGTDKNDTILVGTLAGQHNNADASIFIGKHAGQMNSTGAGNILVGPDAGAQSQESSQNIMMGSKAGSAYLGLTTAGQNIFIGDNVARDVTLGDQNIAIGANAMISAGNVSATIAIGFEAGRNIGNRDPVAGGDANRNIIIGYQSVGDGDINSDNILVGTQVAQHVNSPITFEGNLLMGTRAGHNANLSVNSIAIGNANQLGTGGVTNILMGTSAGDNVGTALLYYATTITNIVTGSLSVNISLPYGQAYTYFRDGDHLMIRTADAYFEPVLASIQVIAGDDSNCTVIFSSAYAGATTIFGGATLFTTAQLDNRVGSQDASKASGNSMLGDNAGKNLTAGSKNIGFGTQAMYSNRIGKYNNIIGTQAGYNVISDNNTLLGTRAGYSLDISANTASLVSSDLIFASNANAIYSTSLSNLSDYEFGTIIDINNTTHNDSRYTVESSASNASNPAVPSYLIVQGNPNYEELGVPAFINPNAIKVNAPYFTVLNQTAGNMSNTVAGWFELDGSQYNGLYVTGGDMSFIDVLRNTGSTFKIVGSKYNDGIHYADSTSGIDTAGYVAVRDKLMAETFDANTVISAVSITADPNKVTTGNDFTDFNYGNDMYMFFTNNKGVYNASSQTKKYQLSIPDVNSVYVNEKATIMNDYEQQNIIFASGYKGTLSYISTDTATTYQDFAKLEIAVPMQFLNNVIIVSQIASYGVSAGVFYELECYDTGNNLYGAGTVIKVSSISTSGTDLLYAIDPDYPLPGNASLNRVIFKKAQIKSLSRDVSSDFAEGDIVQFNISHEYGMANNRGAFIIRKAISVTQTDQRLLIQGDQIIPAIYNDLITTQDKLYGSNGTFNSSTGSNTAGILPASNSSLTFQNSTYRILQTNSNVASSIIQDPSKIVQGWGMFCQDGVITATASNIYTLDAGNSVITASNDYEFAKLVVPCFIHTGAPDNETYIVKENKYPFSRLVIDTDYSALGSGSITSFQYGGISSRFDSANISSSLSPGIPFNLFGINNPDQVAEASIPIYSASNITAKCIDVAPGFNVNSFDKVMTIASYDTDTVNSTPGWINGYFKHSNVSANVTVLYNNIYNSLYEPASYALNTNTYIQGKRLIINPDVTDSEKYVISNAGTAGSAWVNISGFGAPSNIFTSASPGLNTITFTSPIDIYGESFSQAKISKSGYVLFESNADVYQLSFNGSLDNAFGITAGTSNIRVWNVAVGSGVNAPGYTMIHYLVDPNLASLDQSGNNNVQLKIFPSSATYKPNRIELCYSNNMTQVSTTEQVVVGLDRIGAPLKECRFTTELSSVDNITRDCPYRGYQATEFDLNMKTVYVDKTPVIYDTTPSSIISPGIDFYKVLGMNDNWIYTGNSPSNNVSNISVYQTDATNTWTLYEELNLPTFDVTDASTYMSITYSDNRLIIGNPALTVAGSAIAGEIYYYKYDGITWSNLQQTINLDGTTYGVTLNEAFGHVLSLSNDKLVVGTYRQTGYGCVYLYDYDYITDQFILRTRISSSSYTGIITGDLFGYNLALYNNYLAVFASGTTNTIYVNQGAIYLFDVSGTSTTPDLVRTFTSNETSVSLTNRNFGFQCIQFYNENQILISDASYNDLQGRIYIAKTLDNWSSITTNNIIRATDIVSRFATSFSIYKNTLITTSSISVFSSPTSIYLYTYDGQQWVNEQTVYTGTTDYNSVAIGKYGYAFCMSNYSYTNPLSLSRGDVYYTEGVLSSDELYTHYEYAIATPNSSYPLNRNTTIFGNYMAVNSYAVGPGGKIYFYKLVNNRWQYMNQVITLNATNIYMYNEYLFAEPTDVNDIQIKIYKRDLNDNWALYYFLNTGGVIKNTDHPTPFVAKDNFLFFGNISSSSYANTAFQYDYIALTNPFVYVTPPSTSSASRFGYALASSENYLVVSDPAPTGDYTAGVVYIYSHSAGYASPVYTLDVSSTSITSPSYFGLSVKINSADNIVVGAPYSNSNVGAFTMITTTSSAFDTVNSVDGNGSLAYVEDFGKCLGLLDDDKLIVSSNEYWFVYDGISLSATYARTLNNTITYITSSDQYIAINTDDSNVHIYTDWQITGNNNRYIYTKQEYAGTPYINTYTTNFTNITASISSGSSTLDNLFPATAYPFTLNGIQYDTANITIYKTGSIGFKGAEFPQYINVLGGYEFDRAYSNISSNVLSVVFDKDLGNGTYGKAYAELYGDSSVYKDNITLRYLNLPVNTLAGAVSISSVPYNHYNSNLDIQTKSTNFSIKYTSPGPELTANLALLDAKDILNVQGSYYEVLETATAGGNSYVAINIQDGNDDNLNIGDYSIICNEFRTEPTLAPTGETLNYNFRNARTLVGTNSDFLRFSRIRTREYSPYYTAMRDIYVTDASYNFGTKSLDASVNVSIMSNSVVYLRETVPNEYGDLANTGNISATIDKYIISIGTPTLDAGSNIVAQQENINTGPIGFIDVLVNDTGITGTGAGNSIINSVADSLLGNLVINPTSSTITLADIEPDFTTGGAVPYKNDGVTLINQVTNTFDNILPGTYIRVYANAGSFDETYLITGRTNGQELKYDTTFNTPASTTSILFTSNVTLGQDLRVDYGFQPDASIANGSYSRIAGQVISDRIDFNQFSSISPYNPANTAPVANYLAVHPLEVFTLAGLNNESSYGTAHEFYYYNNYKIYDGSFKLLSNAYVATTSNSTLDFHYSGGVNNRTLVYDIGDHALLLPSSNVNAHVVSNIEFINSTGTYTVTFVDAGAGIKYIYNPSATFSTFKAGQLIQVSSSVANDGYYLVSAVNTSTTSRIYIDSAYRDLIVSAVPDSVNIESNVIYSRDIADVDLSVYLPGQKLKVEATYYNNTQTGALYQHNAMIITPDTTTTATSIYIAYPSLVNESGAYSKISKCVLVDESSNIGFSTVSVNAGLNNLAISNQANLFSSFKSGQDLVLSSSTSTLATIQTNSLPGLPGLLSMDFVLVSNVALLAGSTISSMNITKPITFKTIGTAISTITDEGIVKFHYLDAQGNNLMLGSFTGQFAGATALSIQNVFIGNKVGQTNQGSGNILIGNETGFAQSPADGSSTYNNKFAIYKNNFIGVPSNPLIGGDFASGRVGINTIDPDSLLTSVLSTDTKMVVNGKVRAQAFNTFTGTHIVTLVHNPNTLLEPGMLLVSTGKVNKLAIIDTIVECKLSEKALDKTVFGIYANSEYLSISQQEIYHCASVGEGCILVTNINGELENGDYVASSIIPGYGQKQLDDLLHNYTVAKITENIDWSGVYQYVMYDGKAYKRALVACTYHCG